MNWLPLILESLARIIREACPNPERANARRRRMAVRMAIREAGVPLRERRDWAEDCFAELESMSEGEIQSEIALAKSGAKFSAFADAIQL